MIAAIVTTVLAVFFLAYRLYAGKVARLYQLNPQTPTPAQVKNDGKDFVPIGKWDLLAQHFSAISAAGPIFGPIIAALYFGWLPALLWIVLGCIFIGAVHDFSTLIGSVKHGARSVAELLHEYAGSRAYLIFVAYIWLCLIYVLTAFTDVTARAFVNDFPVLNAAGEEVGQVLGGNTAISSVLYLLIGILLGLCLKILDQFFSRSHFKTLLSRLLSALALVGVGLAISFGQDHSLSLPPLGQLLGLANAPLAWQSPASSWIALILLYCGVASILPVWLLLQPRGFLGGSFLYVILFAGLLGLVLGSLTTEFTIQAPAFIAFTSPKLGPLFPVLFITIACGACSGFHGLVCSGTTSKQICSEADTPLIGYAGMLLEAVVAVIALATVMIASQGGPSTPDAIFATGLGSFLSVLGVDRDFAVGFAMLAFATFVFDTIDVVTRLGRYLLQELTGWRGSKGAIVATILTLALPAFMLSTTIMGPDGKVMPSYLAVWPVFGASNQLLAALSFVGLYSWVKKLEPKPWHRLKITVPMLFMILVTFSALFLNLSQWGGAITAGSRSWLDPIGILSLMLTILATLILGLTFRPRR